MRRILAIAFSFCVLAAKDASATSIVAYCSPSLHGVLIEADSLRSSFPKNPILNKNVCKIHAYKNLTIAIAGITSIPDISFDIENLIKQALSPDAPPSANIESADRVVHASLPRAIDFAIAKHPDFIRKLSKYNVALQIAFIAREGSSITVIGRDYIFDPNNTSSITSHDKTCSTETPNSKWIALGFSEQMAEADGPAYWSGISVQDGITHLIEKEILANPEDVGGPIVALLIDRGSQTWVDTGNGICDPNAN
jgi:hypothetical protein